MRRTFIGLLLFAGVLIAAVLGTALLADALEQSMNKPVEQSYRPPSL